jgi:hypothetical protein
VTKIKSDNDRRLDKPRFIVGRGATFSRGSAFRDDSEVDFSRFSPSSRSPQPQLSEIDSTVSLGRG